MALGEIGEQQRVRLLGQSRVSEQVGGRRDDRLALVAVVDFAIRACDRSANVGQQRRTDRRGRR